ncbi:MAG: PstS family phosphate ABC transporter substrate-binding protein, partial [Longimicrobiales bacterium]
MRAPPRPIRALGASRRPLLRRALVAAACLLGFGCGSQDRQGLRDQVSIDGSSTVYPIAEAVSEEFQLRNPRVMVSLGRSGSGGGFERFCRGETDVATASRTIRDFEAQRCAAQGVEYLELPVALDGLSVIVNPGNTFVNCLTVHELREIWRPGSPVRTWRDVRPEFPAEEIKLYGPGTDSGTFDTFSEAIVGEMGASRMDFQASEDDNVLVNGLTRDRYSLGYFGYAYLAENRERLKVVAVDGGSGCVTPSPETIRDGRYTPLGRQLYLYVKVGSLSRPGMNAFLGYFLTQAREFVVEAGFSPLSDQAYAENLDLVRRVVGI